MRGLYVILFCFLPLLGLSARQVHVEDIYNFLDSILKNHKNMHFYRSSTVGSADSVWHSSENFYLYFDTDSICRQFVRKGGYNAVPDEMDYLYFAVFSEMTPERKAVEIEKMEKIAKQYNSEALKREMELQKITLLADDSDEQFDYWLLSMRELQNKAEKRHDTLMQIRIKEGILYELRGRNRVFEALEETVSITKILDNIDNKLYAGYGNLCFFVGETFYIYGDYEQSIPFFKKILKPAQFFFDRSNLCARMTLGLYYRKKGDLDLSDDYFRSMLESSDMVKYRGEYDAIAMCELGKNCLLRKDYIKAELLLRKGLSVMINFEPVFSAGVFIDLGNCYLETRKLPKAKAAIDSAQKYVAIYQRNVVYQTDALTVNLYPLMSKYYATIGDIKTSKAYTDSTVNQYVEYQKKYNVSHIFQIEKKLYETEKETKEKQLQVEKMKKERYRNILVLGLLIIFMIIGFYVLYVRLRRQKNRVLYKRIMEENRIREELSDVKQDLFFQPHENIILQRLENLMKTEHLFTNPELSRKDLANRLFTNETYLINAIKEKYNGQTFSDYINSLRLLFARQLLQNNSEISIKEIASDAGFSSYKYFHRLFREEFGMSPSDFRSCI